MSRQVFLDEAVGETRAALFEDDQPVELWIERWSERETPRVGDRYWGRVVSVDTRLPAAFLDLGDEVPAFMPLRRRATSLTEGMFVKVKIIREAIHEKGPHVRPVTASEVDGQSRPASGRPGRVQTAPSLLREGSVAFFSREWWDGCDVITGAEAKLECERAVELALAREWALPMGGRIWVEPTRALTAIDVDAGSRQARNQPRDRFNLDLNLAAAEGATRAVRLKGLGGLFAVDFVGINDQPHREAVRKAVQAGLARERAETSVGDVNSFGLLVFHRQRQARSVLELMLDADGHTTVETRALEALQMLEREAAANRGRVVQLRLPPDVLRWLEADLIGWREALSGRIGARFQLVARTDHTSKVEAVPA
jgi:Ribonuclease G/E